MKHQLFPVFNQMSIGSKLFLLIGLVLFGALFGSLLGIVISSLAYDLPLSRLLNGTDSGTSLSVARIIQICGQIGIFILPVLIYSLLVHHSPLRDLGFKNFQKSIFLFSGILLMIFSLPLINLLSEWNEAIKLPESLTSIEQWMKDKEEQAAALSEQFLNVTSISGLLFNLFMIALLPAIGEELLFRSVLQTLFQKLFKNAHVGIIVSAILFGLMHFQFYGLFPRILLGLFLGYLFFWSGSIWVSMAMHFFNNGVAVFVYWLHNNGYIQVEMENFGATSNHFLILSSLLIVIFILIICRRVSNQGIKKASVR